MNREHNIGFLFIVKDFMSTKTKTKAITAYVLQMDFGANAEGDVINMDADEAAPLVEAGILAEATADDVGGDDAEEGEAPPADMPEDNAALTRAVSRLSKNLELGIAKATELAVNKVTAGRKPSGLTVPATVKQPVFKSMGEMCVGLINAKKGDTKAMRMLGAYQDEIRVKAPLGANEGNVLQGGYFLKPEWYKEVWDKIRDYPKLLERTDRYSITGSTFNISTINETGLADGQRHAGVLGYWVAEAASLTSSYPATSTVQAVLQTNVVFVYATNQLLEDANIESFDKKITELAMLELLWQEDAAVISGSGSSQPLGILNQPALVTVTKNAGDTAAMFGFSDLTRMMAALYPPSRPNAVWLMNPEGYAALTAMAFQAAGSTAAGTYPANGLSYNYNDQETPLRIFGKPVIECMMMPQLGAAGDIILCDLKQLITAEKPQVFVDVSEHIQFNTLQTAFRFYRRYDIKSPWTTSLAAADGNFHYSPFVVLQARGT